MPTRAPSDSGSDIERVSPKKASSKQRATEPDEEPEGMQVDEDDQEGEEQEYEIEAILESRKDAFGDGTMGYLVKWKGFPKEDNSWVDEKDAGNATDLIQAFWEKDKNARRKSIAKPKAAGRKSTAEAEPAKKKRVRISKGRDTSEEVKSEEESDGENSKSKIEKRPKKPLKNSLAKKKRDRSEDAEDVNEVSLDDMTSMDKWMNMKNWEGLVENIDALERDGDGKLIVYFSLTTGQHSKMPIELCEDKFPKKLISFFVSHLRWKTVGDPPSD